jgi:hypothetical protein
VKDTRDDFALILLIIVFVLLMFPCAHCQVNPFPIPVRPQVDELFRRASMSFMAEQDHDEFAFSYDYTGKFTDIVTTRESNRDHIVAPPGTVAIVHTHPRYTDAQPSAEDSASAVSTNMDIYVISIAALWVAHPNGKEERVAWLQWKHGHLIYKEAK